MIRRRLTGLVDRGRLPHGMLWIGPDPEEMQRMVRELARTLFCANRSGGSPCGSCLPCGKVDRGHHPDLLFLAAEGKEIKIEKIRELTKWLAVAPNEAPRKIAVLEESDLLNAASSNALLKTLEEPPPHALILLLARSRANFLPTIRSRLMPVRFPAPENELSPEAPPWGAALEALLRAGATPTAEEIFDLTETIAKDKENLRWFFWTSERALRERIAERAAVGGPGQRRLEGLFDLALSTEREILHRYGNTALGLDRFLTTWLL